CKTNCIGGNCTFNNTLGECLCHCPEFFLGESCSFGKNDIPADVDTEAIPTRKAHFTLKINVTFQADFNDLNSSESSKFIEKFKHELEGLCKEADPQSFKRVQVINLSRGSVVAENQAEYIYSNNETQIQFVNAKLDGVLTDILTDPRNLINISRAFNNVTVQFNELTFGTPEIKNIQDMERFVDCSKFANYTAKIINGQWQCVGPCKTNPDYCHQHGECHNDIEKGPICAMSNIMAHSVNSLITVQAQLNAP
ncbi:mucin-3B, partial [Plectropomus leopardus]|uniref:mucin-3B n=1 Tax=Plectropomus leopardus TaxID=160734 RepID=UPI001C4B139F